VSVPPARPAEILDRAPSAALARVPDLDDLDDLDNPAPPGDVCRHGLPLGIVCPDCEGIPHDLDDLDDDGLHRGRHLTLTPAAEIRPARARWLWDGRMPLGALSILAGREGVGKSSVAYWIAARVTRGELPGEHAGEPRAVLVCATEDSWAHTIVPRLIATGADLRRVYRVEVATDFGTAELSLPGDVERVGQAAHELGASLMLLDPLMSRLSASLDTHRDAEVRQALEPLTKMLDAAGMSGLGLLHFNKSMSGDPLNALMGSRAFGAVARAVSTVVKDPDDDTGARRLFGTPKNNLGPDDLPLLSFTMAGYAVPTDDGDCWTARVVWGDEVTGSSISEVMRRAQDDRGDRSATQEAADWLADWLTSQGGQDDSAKIKSAGRAAGHNEEALRRARRRLGVRTESHGFPRRTIWRLDDPPEDASRVTVASQSGETHIYDMTDTTGDSGVSRVSRVSRGGPREPDPTALDPDVESGGQLDDGWLFS
jgi:hypothetical protein